MAVIQAAQETRKNIPLKVAGARFAWLQGAGCKVAGAGYEGASKNQQEPCLVSISSTSKIVADIVLDNWK